MIKDIDYESRIKLTSVLNKNFIVEAGAGSGKTTALVKRLVSMVEHGISVSEISCITFTKAAANEFYERFQSLLSERSHISLEEKEKKKSRPGDLPDVTNESIKLCAKALEEIDLCFMGTIDSFVQKLMNEFPYEFEIPANVSVLDENQENALIKQIYFNILNGDFDKNYNGLSNLCKKASKYFGKIDNFVLGVKYFRNLRAGYIKYDKADNFDLDLNNLIEPYKVNLLKEQIKFVHDLINEKTDGKVSPEVEKYYKYLFLDWNENYFNVINALEKCKDELSIKSSFVKNNKIVIDERVFIKRKESDRNLKMNEDFINPIIDKLQNEVSKIEFELFDKSSKIISNIFSSSGYLTFSDFIINLRDKLKDDANSGGKLIRYIQQKRKYYLLDEFQDTNPIQTEIFFYLTAQNIDSDFTLSNPRPGSLFIVGDPKQSIYRFQGADVSAFLNTKKLFNNEDNEVLYLSRNFRSSKKTKEFFNDTLKKILETKTDKADFIDIPYDNNNEDEENKATLNGIYYYTDTNKRNKLDDKENLLKVINKIVNNDNFIIYDKDKENNYFTKKISYGDIMIITPKKSPLKGIMRLFSENNIPYFIEGATAFEESEALNEIKDLFNVLLLPTRKDLTYFALRTKYISLSESDILEIKSKNIEITLLDIKNNLDKIKNESIETNVKKLVDLYNNTFNLSFSSKFLYLIENINLYERHKIEYMEYVYYAYELLKTACNNNEIITSEDAIEFVENINSDNKNYERCFSISTNDEKNKIHIANLHKTKGLEKNVVILAYPRNPPKKEPQYRTERKGSDTTSYVFSIFNGNQQLFKCDSNGVYNGGDATGKVLEELDSKDAEFKRLEYVAATRAKCALIISYIANDENSIDGYWKDMIDKSHKKLNIINDFEKSQGKKMTSRELFDGELYCNDPYKESKKNALKKSYKIILPSDIKTKKNLDFDIYDDNLIDDNSELVSKELRDYEKEEATKKGTIVHRLMELIINTKSKFSIEDYIKTISSEFVISDDYKILLHNVYNNVIKEDLIIRILNSKETYCELPFCYKENINDETIIHNGVIDLIYVDESGYHIIDYKTNKESDVSKLEEEYKKQLDEYIHALKYINNLDDDNYIDAHIFHIDINNF